MKRKFLNCLMLVGILSFGDFANANTVETIREDSRENAVYIFVNPSRQRINWSSPRTLVGSGLRSGVDGIILDTFSERLMPSYVGHLGLHYKCWDGKIYHNRWTGVSHHQSLKDGGLAGVTFDLLGERNAGMGLLFFNYKAGKIFTHEEARDYHAKLSGRFERNVRNHHLPRRLKTNFFRIEIGQKECKEIVDYVSTFESLSYHPKKSEVTAWWKKPEHEVLSFGFAIDPYQAYLDRKKDSKTPLGGGCSSFAMGALKLSNKYIPSIFGQELKTEFDVSEKLIGKEGQPVSIKRIFSSQWRSWDYPGTKEYRKFSFYDPEKFWDWIDGIQTCSFLNEQGKSKKLPYGNCTKELYSWVLKNKDAIKSVKYDFEYNKTKKKKGRVIREGISLDASLF